MVKEASHTAATRGQVHQALSSLGQPARRNARAACRVGRVWSGARISLKMGTSESELNMMCAPIGAHTLRLTCARRVSNSKLDAIVPAAFCNDNASWKGVLALKRWARPKYPADSSRDSRLAVDTASLSEAAVVRLPAAPVLCRA